MSPPVVEDPRGGFFDEQKKRSFATELAVLGLILVVIGGGAFALLAPLSAAIVRALPPAIDAQVGRLAAATLAAQEPASAGQRARVERVFAEVLAAVPAEDRALVATATVSVLASDAVNAMAAPGAYVFVYTGLLEQVDDEGLRGILAHELGHVVHRHGMRALVRSQLLSLAVLFLVGDLGELEQTVVAHGATLLDLKYSRAQEEESDGYAIQLADAQGWSLAGLIAFYRSLPADGVLGIASTHPDPEERAARLEAHRGR